VHSLVKNLSVGSGIILQTAEFNNQHTFYYRNLFDKQPCWKGQLAGYINVLLVRGLALERRGRVSRPTRSDC